MQQKETERADDRIDEEFYEELSEEEIQDEIASCTGDGVTWMPRHYAESTARYG